MRGKGRYVEISLLFFSGFSEEIWVFWSVVVFDGLRDKGRYPSLALGIRE